MRTALRLGLSLALAVLFAGTAAMAQAGDPLPPKDVSFSFEGPFGMYDRAALQRGFQIYNEVCKNCHSLNRVSFTSLTEPGGPEFTEAEAKARGITLPPKLHRRIGELTRAARDAYGENAEEPTDAELADVLGWTEADIARTRALPVADISLNELTHTEQADEPDELGDLLPDPTAQDPSAAAIAASYRTAARAAILQALDGMDKEAALALRLRWGLGGAGFATCAEVAEAMETTPARVYQALRRARRALQASQAARAAYDLAA